MKPKSNRPDDYPKVSIICLAYNHAPYINQSLDSLLEQSVINSTEIIIAEDCSTDDTHKIVSKYAKKHPQNIRLLKNTNNLGMQENFHRALDACKGEFIAICEGDDFWNDPMKLELQTAALLESPNVNVCFTNAHILSPDGTKASKWNYGPSNRFISTKELLSQDGIVAATATLLFRKTALGGIGEWILKAPVADIFYLMNAMKNSGIIYLPQKTVTYRLFASNSWTEQQLKLSVDQKIDRARAFVLAYQSSQKETLIPNHILNYRLRHTNWALAKHEFKAANIILAMKYFSKCGTKYGIKKLIKLIFGILKGSKNV